jgi:hypothetical protein
MKYIKTYHLFESSAMKSLYEEEEVKKTDEMIADLKDILLELSDIGYTNRVDYKVISPWKVNQHPEIQINITKMSEGRYLPLWNSEDDKTEFDDVILRVLRYAITEGYKYEYEGITSGTSNIRTRFQGQVVNYKITLYKD